MGHDFPRVPGLQWQRAIALLQLPDIAMTPEAFAAACSACATWHAEDREMEVSKNRATPSYHHPRLKMYTHWGTRPKKVYILGPFGRDCIPHLASYILNFW